MKKILSRLIVSVPIFGTAIATLILLALSFEYWWSVLLSISSAVACIRMLDTYESDCEVIETLIKKLKS